MHYFCLFYTAKGRAITRRALFFLFFFFKKKKKTQKRKNLKTKKNNTTYTSPSPRLHFASEALKQQQHREASVADFANSCARRGAAGDYVIHVVEAPILSSKVKKQFVTQQTYICVYSNTAFAGAFSLVQQQCNMNPGVASLHVALEAPNEKRKRHRAASARTFGNISLA